MSVRHVNHSGPGIYLLSDNPGPARTGKFFKIPATFQIFRQSNVRIPEKSGLWQLKFNLKSKSVMEDILIPLGICVVMPVMIVWLVFRSRNRMVDKKMEVLMKAIENGQDIDPELFADDAASRHRPANIKMRLLKQLCWGVILFLAGAGILIGTMYTADNVSMFIGGGILVACGVALLVTFAVGKKWLEPEIMAEEKGAVDKSRTDGKEPGQEDAEL